MNIGKLSDRIIPLSKEEGIDENRRPSSLFVPGKPIWATVKWLRGKELIEAKASKLEVTARIFIRWRKGLTSEMKIRIDGKDYEIESVLPLPGRKTGLEIMIKG